MKLLVSCSTKKALPKWASKFDDPSYFDMLNTGKVNARHSIKVLKSPTAHKVVGPWGGSWSVDFTGAITVELQDTYVRACNKSKCAWSLGHTIMHELEEAKAAIELARKKYPEQSPFLMANLSPGNLGGDAHTLACKRLDGMSEWDYADELDKDNLFIGWNMSNGKVSVKR